MAAVYLYKPSSERSRSKRKSRAGSVHSQRKSQLSGRSSHSNQKPSKPTPKNPISDKLSKAIQGCTAFRSGRSQKRKASRSPKFSRKRAKSVQSELKQNSMRKTAVILPQKIRALSTKKVIKKPQPIRGIQSYRNNRSGEKHQTPKRQSNLNIKVNNFSANESIKKEILMFSAQPPSIEPLQSCLRKETDLQDSFVSSYKAQTVSQTQLQRQTSTEQLYLELKQKSDELSLILQNLKQIPRL